MGLQNNATNYAIPMGAPVNPINGAPYPPNPLDPGIPDPLFPIQYQPAPTGPFGGPPSLPQPQPQPQPQSYGLYSPTITMPVPPQYQHHSHSQTIFTPIPPLSHHHFITLNICRFFYRSTPAVGSTSFVSQID